MGHHRRTTHTVPLSALMTTCAAAGRPARGRSTKRAAPHSRTWRRARVGTFVTDLRIGVPEASAVHHEPRRWTPGRWPRRAGLLDDEHGAHLATRSAFSITERAGMLVRAMPASDRLPRLQRHSTMRVSAPIRTWSAAFRDALVAGFGQQLVEPRASGPAGVGEAPGGLQPSSRRSDERHATSTSASRRLHQVRIVERTPASRSTWPSRYAGWRSRPCQHARLPHDVARA